MYLALRLNATVGGPRCRRFAGCHHRPPPRVILVNCAATLGMTCKARFHLSSDSPHSALGVGRLHSVMLRGRKRLKLCESDLPNKCHVELIFCHAPLGIGAQWRLVIGQGTGRLQAEA